MTAETGCGMRRARLFTVSPFESSLNFYSLGRTREESARLVTAIRKIAPVTEWFEVDFPDWPFGYGTVRHDALPVFFQPTVILRLKTGDGVEVTRGDQVFRALSAELHFYDDCIGVLFVEWATDRLDCPSSEFDDALTGATKRLFRRHIHHCLDTLQRELANDGGAMKVLRAPDEYSVYTPVSELPDSPVWTARSVIVADDAAPGDPLVSKLGGLPPEAEDLDGARAWVGSGNSLFSVAGSAMERFTEDWMRSMSLCQFYATLLSRYQTILLAEVRVLEHAGERDIRRQILGTLERKLDHLDFVRLQHERALYGLQGVRRQLARYIHKSWESELQFENVRGWAALLRKQIDRYYRARQLAQTRILKSFVAVIGGLSLFDLALVMVNEARTQGPDDVVGLLDMFQDRSPDMVLYFAVGILLLLMLITYLSEK
ncbi:hypothetical protein [Salipiger abyssi]|uniref:Uncharacterized protein n=1 Tax=Salipiger abyssi TaxID=1250539 RepID=A0A1P8UT53_9RHOB|nr:hypothetical protein [Salipiger abyssi]APZ52579.1 hypothetical protein Ga0080574_TMP2245 [Salipiger abyssi]